MNASTGLSPGSGRRTFQRPRSFPLSSLSSLGTLSFNLRHCSLALPGFALSANRIIQYVLFCVQLFSFSIAFMGSCLCGSCSDGPVIFNAARLPLCEYLAVCPVCSNSVNTGSCPAWSYYKSARTCFPVHVCT